jgi:serine/threonine-protein kinase
MAPEQVRGETIDARTDIYALGILTYEMLTGEPPFKGKFYQVMEAHQETPIPSPRASGRDLPDDLEELVLKAAAKSPRDRFQSCEEMASLLSDGEPLSKLAVETVTFAYDPAQKEAVKKLVEEIRSRGGEIPSVRVF